MANAMTAKTSNWEERPSPSKSDMKDDHRFGLHLSPPTNSNTERKNLNTKAMIYLQMTCHLLAKTNKLEASCFKQDKAGVQGVQAPPKKL